MASPRNVLEGIMPEVLAARDILERDERRRAMDRWGALAEEEARKAYMMRHPELHNPLPSEPVEIKEKNVLTDPKSWLNTGLRNLAGNAASVILGEPSGNNVVDLGAANVPGVGAASILAAGGMPGIVDFTGLGALKNLNNYKKLLNLLTSLKWVKKNDSAAFDIFFKRLGDSLNGGSSADPYNIIQSGYKGALGTLEKDRRVAKLGGTPVPEYMTMRTLVLERLGDGYTPDELKEVVRMWNDESAMNKAYGIVSNLDNKYAREEYLKQQAHREELNKKLEGTRQATQNLSTFTSNPKKAAQEIVDGNLSIEDYLGDNLSKIRPGQRKQVEDQLRKLGVDIPEEVVEQAPVVVKKEKPKEVQLPKSEKQRLAAIETAQKTWKKKPNDVFKSIDKGRTPEDYFKGAENIPEDFADKYAAHLAEKEGRKAEQAAQQEAARAQAEIDRQNAQATQKQLEREAAEKASRDAIAKERERLENERAMAELFAYRSSPEGVLQSGWKPSEHPPMGGAPYPDYAVSDIDKRNHFYRDSVATQILKGFTPENPVTGGKMKDMFPRAQKKEIRHQGTNYDQMMANFYRELEDAKQAGRYTGPTSGADAMDRAMYEDSFRKQYDKKYSEAIDALFFRRPTR